MRWLLPFVFALALAVCTADDLPAPRRKRVWEAFDGGIWADPEGAALGRASFHAPGGPRFHDDPAAAGQSATFDAATGTLTWFDDENYN